MYRQKSWYLRTLGIKPKYLLIRNIGSILLFLGHWFFLPSTPRQHKWNINKILYKWHIPECKGRKVVSLMTFHANLYLVPSFDSCGVSFRGITRGKIIDCCQSSLFGSFNSYKHILNSKQHSFDSLESKIIFAVSS